MPALLQLLLSLLGGGLGQFGAKKLLGGVASRAGSSALGRFAGSKAGQVVGDLGGFVAGSAALPAIAEGLQGDVESGEPALQQFNAGEETRLENVFKESDLQQALAELGINLDELNLPRGVV